MPKTGYSKVTLLKIYVIKILCSDLFESEYMYGTHVIQGIIKLEVIFDLCANNS